MNDNPLNFLIIERTDQFAVPVSIEAASMKLAFVPATSKTNKAFFSDA
jgi:hypothetical protein